ncbi:uncharacterized protein PODANS_6_9965 [Podospora anserina S mat+]|uniref:Podospora anserina S mat+ genomic DNA chromosome 6, supercontig 4 n=1 Tax=Podospora anserina (strain S / ATCC MYA-4624 / DSM 980 / FGSC 10383) TaxID=515849 RepID=B2ANS8_PODAN|nr:uncharacterized protein PODANS_6_9965 [Podospora anserina S mat+]CAP65500.1 unnamed protein product [Podospora anserina S mat+]CDP31495.1 Putative protein of unknown function [Podospora anserina S mat+]
MKLTTLTLVSTLTTLSIATPVLHWPRQVNDTTLPITNGTALTAPTTEAAVDAEPVDATTDLTMATNTNIMSSLMAIKLLDAVLGVALGEVLVLNLGAYVQRFNAMMNAGMGMVGQAGVVEEEGKGVVEPMKPEAVMGEIVDEVEAAVEDVEVEAAEPVVGNEEGVEAGAEAMMMGA